MFQTTGLCHNKQRPPIMHAYGGAKTGMAQALQSIASEGWIPLAAALAPLAKNPFGRTLAPQLTLNSGPTPLSTRNWSCSYPVGNVGIGSIPGSAINTWLKNVNLAVGPDCEDSPHFRRTDMDDLEAMRLLVELLALLFCGWL